MEPLTLGLGALGAYLLLKGMKKRQADLSTIQGGFDAFPPDEQGPAWYYATSLQWTPTGGMGDNAGRSVKVFRGGPGGDAAQNRMLNDAAFRKSMADGVRVVVSRSVLGGGQKQGAPPYLILAPDGFARSSLPGDWGDLRQLYAPPPGSFGQPAPGPFGGSVQQNPFDEIPDPAARAQALELYTSDTVGLLALDEAADSLDKAGYHASASALRQRRQELALSRALEAQKRGGWLYVVRQGDLPINIAQYYAPPAKKPGALKELKDINPAVSQNNWKGWIGGAEILLPSKWPDPSLKPLPPLAQGKPGGQPQQGGQVPQGGGSYPQQPPGGFSSVMTPWGLYSTNAPLPPGTTAQPSPAGGQEAFPVPPGTTAPNGFIWGPPWMGKWTPPQPGKIDPYGKGEQGMIDVGVTPSAWEQSN